MQSSSRFTRMMTRRGLIAGGMASFAVAASAIPARCRGKLYPGTNIHGIDVAGLVPDDAEMLIRSSLQDFEDHALTVEFDGRSWRASLAELGFSLDYAAMLRTAHEHGRDEGVAGRYRAFLDTTRGSDIELVLREDSDVLDAWLDQLASDIDVAPENARLVNRDGTIEIVEHTAGRSLDKATARNDVRRHVRAGKRATTQLLTNEVEPDVLASDLERAKEEAWALVREPIVFNDGELAYPIGAEHLTAALVIDKKNRASLDTSKLEPRLSQISQAVATPAKNVMLGWDDGLYVVEDDVDGMELDVDAAGELAVELAASDTRSAELPLKPVPAGARADNLDELGIENHLAFGSSSFAGSSTARAANVRVSSDNISYKLVGPGETFSFNDLIGPISEEHGYVAGTIIQGDWVASDIGGGVCQVSTTVFRAAANAGFRFSEWHPHSWRLAFYETDGSDPGFDGAIYQANSEWETNLDLRFENVLDSWLLLMMVIDGNTVRAHFYGKDPGWNVEVFPARVSDPVEPGDPVERVNASLAPGERKMVQQAQPGYLVRVRRKITGADGEVIADGDFVSDYVPQPEAWEVGPS